VHRVQGLRVCGLHAVDHVLQARLQRRDRRPQLVRDVGDQLATLAVGLGDLAAHRVERLGELGHLVVALDLHRLAVLAARHRLGCGGHLTQRPGHAARQEMDDEQREHTRYENPPALVQRGWRCEVQTACGDQRDECGRGSGNDHDAELGLDGADPAEWVEVLHLRGSVSSA
jgi:hypothetical protein